MPRTRLAGRGPAQAELTADEVARLGADLTPVGAEKAGNADGTIPAWEGGITKPPAGYKPGDHHPDPYAGDKVLFTITGGEHGRVRRQADARAIRRC